MRNETRGQVLTLLALAALLIIAGVSVWLLISDRPADKPMVPTRGGQQVDLRR